MRMWGKLDSEKNVVSATVEEFGKMLEDPGRIVAQDTIGDHFVSTVFLGLNHGWGEREMWFETMVFDAAGDSIDAQRYETWGEAELGHRKAKAELEFNLKVPARAPTAEELVRYGFRKLMLDS